MRMSRRLGLYSQSRVHKIARYGKAPNATRSRCNSNNLKTCGVRVGSYALFAGGSDDYPNTAEAYTASLVHTNAANFSNSRKDWAGAPVGSYAVYLGGYTGNYSGLLAEAYNASLVHSIASAPANKQSSVRPESLGNAYALFAGGYGTGGQFSNVWAYNASLVKTSAPSLSTAYSEVNSVDMGDKALFTISTSYVDVYSTSLIKSSAPKLSGSSYISGTMAGKTALFPLGGMTSSFIATVDTYNQSLVKGAQLTRSTKAGMAAARSISEFAVIAGGTTSYPSSAVALVDAFNAKLIRQSLQNLSVARMECANAVIGDKLLILGGFVSGTDYVDVDVYQAS